MNSHIIVIGRSQLRSITKSQRPFDATASTISTAFASMTGSSLSTERGVNGGAMSFR